MEILFTYSMYYQKYIKYKSKFLRQKKTAHLMRGGGTKTAPSLFKIDIDNIIVGTKLPFNTPENDIIYHYIKLKESQSSSSNYFNYAIITLSFMFEIFINSDGLYQGPIKNEEEKTRVINALKRWRSYDTDTHPTIENFINALKYLTISMPPIIWINFEPSEQGKKILDAVERKKVDQLPDKNIEEFTQFLSDFFDSYYEDRLKTTEESFIYKKQQEAHRKMIVNLFFLYMEQIIDVATFITHTSNIISIFGVHSKLKQNNYKKIKQWFHENGVLHIFNVGGSHGIHSLYFNSNIDFPEIDTITVDPFLEKKHIIEMYNKCNDILKIHVKLDIPTFIKENGEEIVYERYTYVHQDHVGVFISWPDGGGMFDQASGGEWLIGTLRNAIDQGIKYFVLILEAAAGLEAFEAFREDNEEFRNNYEVDKNEVRTAIIHEHVFMIKYITS